MKLAKFVENLGIKLALFAAVGVVVWFLLKHVKSKDETKAAAGIGAAVAGAAPLL